MRRRVIPVAALLFGSGSCALIYQIAWMREFRLIFGATTAASAAVLAIFMGGLGLGNALLGRRADRSANPLRFYAVLELVIVFSVALSPFLVDLARALYVGLGGRLGLGFELATGVRLLLSTLVLAVPTVAMGGTLPAAARAVTEAEDASRRDVALLYGLNTLGAVTGAAVTTFVLLEVLGTRMTVWVACTLNLALALTAYSLSKSRLGRMPQRVAAPTGAPAHGSDVATEPVLPAPLVYAVAAVVGFAFFLMELVWFRMLAPLLGGTTFSFGLILVVALLGIGVGGATYHAIFSRFRPTPGNLALICAIEAVGLAAPLALGDPLAILALRLRETLATTFAGEVLGWILVAAIVVLPAAVAAGVQFPMLIALLGKGRDNLGKQVGYTFAWNTIGAILGSLAGGFGMLPSLTAPGTWRAVTVLLAVLSLVVLIGSFRKEAKYRVIASVVAALLALLLLVPTGPTAAWRHSGIGAGRAGLESDSPNGRRKWFNRQRRRVIWQADGVEAGVAVSADDGFAFIVNGKVDGHSVLDAASFIMPGVVGALAHPQPRTALVVGLGTGESAGWMADMPGMQRVDVVELEPALDEIARLCSAGNRDVLEHPKIRRIYDDAREILLTTSERFDLVFSQPSNPYRAGIANLFTREYYRAIRDRLNPRGIFLQWMQAYEVDPQTVGTVLATLRAEFAHVELWQADTRDLLMVCSETPPRWSAEELRRRLEEEPFHSAVTKFWRAADAEGFVSHFIGGPALVDRLAERAVRINTDDRNQLEYGAARTVGRHSGFSIAELWPQAVELGTDRPEGLDDVDWARVEDYRTSRHALENRVVPEHGEPPAERLARARMLVEVLRGDMRAALAAWDSQSGPPRLPRELAFLAYAHAELGSFGALPLLDELAGEYPIEADAIRALLLMRQGDAAAAAERLVSVFRGMRDDPWPGPVPYVFPMAVDLARADPSQTGELYAALREPFALRAFDETRRVTACSIARQIGNEALVQCLLSFEPYVPWTESFLSTRYQAYNDVDHPLMERAGSELAEFRRNAGNR